MCSIVLRISQAGVLIGANRDEMLDRAWDPPAQYWPDLPGVVAGRDRTAGGTWLGMNTLGFNRHGMVAAVLNRTGTLGPAPGKSSRGELPLLALKQASLEAAAKKILALDAGNYRSFNFVLADASGGLFFRGLEAGAPLMQRLGAGTWMITSGEANDTALPRTARHLPKFTTAPAEAWPALLADNTPPEASALNIPPHDGFGTVSSALITLSKSAAPIWLFAAGPPHLAAFQRIPLA
jgi:uncharacterized protein with NRDE domain